MPARKSENSHLFESNTSARMLPACRADSKTPYAWHKHASQPGFYIRASKVDKHGKFDLEYFHRYKLPLPLGAAPGTQREEKRDPLGTVGRAPKDDFERALDEVREKRKKLRGTNAEDEGNRLTVASAWAYYGTEKFTNKPATKEKDHAQYERYLSHLGNRYLDELPRAFWASFLEQLREGTLVVGTRTDKHGATVPAILGPLASATLIGVMNTAALLYEIGNKNNGLHGNLKGENPPASLRKNIGAPNERSHHIALKDLGTAWRASDLLVAPWWRDLFRVFVLTGMRRSLLFGMRFDEIDFRTGTYVIAPGKRGAKRKGEKITPSTKPIRLPLSKFVFDIIQRRREFAPDKNGLVWFTPKPSRGRRTKDEKQSLSDPRAAWTLLEWAIGDVHFTPHDLRRTFATVGSVATEDLFAVSLLMLHTGDQLAKAAGVPGITLKYMDTDEAVGKMRNAAEEITAYVLALAAMPVEQAATLVDPVLVPDLEDAIEELA